MVVIDHKARGHARFGASSAARWFACPGSVALCDQVPNRGGAAADEGTRAHELLEVLLRCSAQGRSDEAHEYLGAASQEMKDAVLVAFFFVQDILADHPDAVMLVEHPFEIPVAAAPGEVWGTCDVVIFVPSLRLLYVIDYKHGAGVFVDVRGNKQLRFYGLGALASWYKEQTGWTLSAYPHNEGVTAIGHIDTVALTIIQPRCAFGEPIRDEWLSVEDVLEFGRDLGAAVRAARTLDAPLVPGEEQCRFCPAKTVCPAREQQALEAAGASFASVAVTGAVAVPAARELTNEKIAEVLDAKDLIVDWLESVADEAFARMQGGAAVRDRKLVEVQARRQWEEGSVERLSARLAEIVQGPKGDHHDLDRTPFVETKIRGLTEIEAILKKGVDRAEAKRRLEAMAFLTTKKSSGKLTIAPESDPRPAVSRTAEAFAGVQFVDAERRKGDDRLNAGHRI